MSETTKPFKIPGECTSQTPFEHLDFWRWMQTVPRREINIGAYLESQGFVTGMDHITSEEYDVMHHAAEMFLRCMPHIPGERAMSELLTPAQKGDDGEVFYVQGVPGMSYCRISDLLRRHLANAGWIYNITPDTTYFYFVPETRTLWAKYQTIIGGRPMAKVKLEV